MEGCGRDDVLCICYIIFKKDTQGMDHSCEIPRAKPEVFLKGSVSCVSFLKVNINDIRT